MAREEKPLVGDDGKFMTGKKGQTYTGDGTSTLNALVAGSEATTGGDGMYLITAIAEDSLEMATVSLGGVEAYQIYGYYPADDQWLVIWLFDSPYDDYIHYVSAEFLSDNMDLFSMVENSYRFAE